MRQVFTIAAHGRLADLLAEGILARHGANPLELARITVLLPTRRACRAMREAFLRIGGGRPMVLPRMLPLGEVDEDAFAFVEDGANGLDLPPAMPPLARQCLLARIIGQAVDPATGEPPSVEQALGLAEALALLLDQVQAEELSFDRLDAIGLDLPAHWQRVVAVLRVITQHWPPLLAAAGRIDPMARRVALMRRQAEIWARHPPEGPVIAAGSTGSHPATAALLAAVATLPQGAVVLPGLDRDIDEDSWTALEPTHPQYGLKRLLATIGAERNTVADWHPLPPPPPRAALIRDLFRPAATADAWTETTVDAAAAEGLFRLDCRTPREEATAIALIFRETLETPGKTAALVTPDRDLARRVAEQMRRWGVNIDDTAGVPLGQTMVGRFLRLVAEAALDGFSPVALLALLRHPLCALGRGIGARAVADFDRHLARGPKPAAGWGDYRHRLDALESSGKLSPARLLGLNGLIELAAAAAQPLATALARPTAPLPDLVRAHIASAEALAGTVETEGWKTLWRGTDGEAVQTFLRDALEATADLNAVAPTTYGAIFDTLAAGVAVRPRFGGHPRLLILGPLEARLQSADVMLLGGMNEGAWPRDPAPDPWMSRKMRADFGLPPPERRIGLAAHDVMVAMGAPTAILTRAEKMGGAPTEPSRWLRRLDAVLAAGGAPCLAAGPWLDWTRGLDAAPATVPPPQPPAPCPPLSARPRELSATHIEMLRRDAYGIYAKYVLRLRKLDDREQKASPADLGTLMHKMLETFIQKGGRSDDPDALDALRVLAATALAEHDVPPELAPFWRSRIDRALTWFVATDGPRRAAIDQVFVECEGAWKFTPRLGLDFTVTAKADRLDVGRDGQVTVIDYKTGVLPSMKEVAAGYAPQLPLEGAIVRNGRFQKVTSKTVNGLEYWRVNGGGQGGERKELEEVAALIAAAEDGIRGLIDHYDDPAHPYLPRAVEGAAPKYSDYLILERLAEWAAADGGTEGES